MGIDWNKPIEEGLRETVWVGQMGNRRHRGAGAGERNQAQRLVKSRSAAMGHNLHSLPSNVSSARGKTPVSLGCKRFGQRGSMRADQDRRDVRVLGSRLWAGGKKTLAPINVTFRTRWKQGRSRSGGNWEAVTREPASRPQQGPSPPRSRAACPSPPQPRLRRPLRLVMDRV